LPQMNAVQRIFGAALRQLIFPALYNCLAVIYDPISFLVSAGQWNTWRLYALDYIRGKEVLEIGFGTGRLLAALYSLGYYVTGIDPSTRMHALAKKRLPEELTKSRLIVCRVQKMPFPDASFDTVISTFPTEYILEEDTFREVHRVLRENGRYVIVLSGELLPTNWYNKVLIKVFSVLGYNTCPAHIYDKVPYRKYFVGRRITRQNNKSLAHILILEKVPN